MPATRGRRPSRPQKLKGFILPEIKAIDDEAENSGEEEEEERQPEFLDVAEMDGVSSGGHVFHSSVPPCRVKFQPLNGEVRYLHGRFALRSPWWEVTCFIQSHGSRDVVKGFPSYKLRSDMDRQNWRHIVSLFLTACGVEDQCISLLFQWLPPSKMVSLHNLMEVLDEFSEGENESQAEMITAQLSNSVAWMQVEASCQCPGVMKYLPTLLPGLFSALLGMGKKSSTLPATQPGQSTQQADGSQDQVNISLLHKLEKMIANDVWKLGFSRIVFKEVKLVRCEAQLRAFKECNLLEKIPQLQRHALLIYDKLKTHCRSTGSTYMALKELSASFIKNNDMSDEQTWNAVHFLKTQGVVVCCKHKVVLQNFDLYETGIAECLKFLVDQEPWTIPVNVREILQAAAKDRHNSTQNNSTQNTEAPTTQLVPTSPAIKSEVNVADDSSSSHNQQAETDSDLSRSQLDEDHVRAAEKICANPVTIISGKAGSGKTTVISQLFRAAVLHGRQEQWDVQDACSDSANEWDDPPASPSCLSQPDEDERRALQSEEEILLTAPTGRAASLLSKKTSFAACTLHQVLCSFMRTEKDEQRRPKLWRFRNVRILVVDEGSMVSVQLLHSVLDQLTKHAKLRKLVILGDVRQLPSIDPGNVLHDLFYSLKRVGWAVEMRTNHRAESQLIVHNAARIADMGMNHSFSPLEFDAKVDLDGPCDTLTADKKFILIRLPRQGSDDDLQRAVKFLIDTAPGLDEHSTSQFITFKRDDVTLINELCCQRYNHHSTKKLKNKLDFQPGDKVCCTKNGYIQTVGDSGCRILNRPEADVTDQTSKRQRNEKEKDSVRLCNGEIFFITEDKTVLDGKGRRHRYLTLGDAGDREFTMEYKELQKECKLRHAWARTIHTFQGSENETIVYVVGDSGYQTWKHIYTAVTRGQKRVYVVSKETSIESAIRKREIPRDTRLGGLVKDKLVRPEMLLGTPQAQPNTPQAQPNTPQAQPNTPQGTPASCGRQRFTPLRSQPHSQPMPLHRKRLWGADGDEEGAAQTSAVDDMLGSSAVNSSSVPPAEQLDACEEMDEDKQGSGATMSGGNIKKWFRCAQQEAPCKQP